MDTQKKALRLLRHFRTARELAEKLGVSRVNAYRIIAAVSASEAGPLEQKKVRNHATGPLAIAYRLVPVQQVALP